EFLEYIKSASSYQPQQLTESMKKGAVVSTMGISGSKNKQIDEKEYLMGMKRLNKLNYQKANDIIDEHWGNVTKGLNMMKVANKLSYEMTEARNAKQTFIVYRN
ncbi:hypothetical protein HN827_06755, partial [archaeon]|nr:hypothetical protein [archaeon]